MTTGNEPPVPADTPPQGDGPPPEWTHNERQRAHDGKFERSMDTVTRDAQAAELRAAPHRLTYQQIADELGMSSKGDAWRAVRRAKADVARPAVTKLIQTESEELDDLYVMALEIIERNHVVVSHGKVVTMLDPGSGVEKPLTDSGPKLQAIQAALKIRESYRRLHGLDAEQKVNVSGSVKYELVGVDPADLT